MKNIFLILFLLLSLTSCQQFVENILERDAIDNYNSPYQGNYVGTYIGDVSGKFTLQVGKSGNIFGLRDDVDNFGGKVYEGGSLNNVQSPYSGFTLTGSLVEKKGSWKIGNSSGTWTVTKQ